MHYVRHVAQAQQLGLGQPSVLQPARRIKPGALQLDVIIEQVEAMQRPGLLKIGGGPAVRIRCIYVARPGSPEPAVAFFIGEYTLATSLEGEGFEQLAERRLGMEGIDRAKSKYYILPLNYTPGDGIAIGKRKTSSAGSGIASSYV